MQKQIPSFSFPVQFYWITPFCSKYFVRDCRLRLGFCHLCEHELRHGFRDILYHLCFKSSKLKAQYSIFCVTIFIKETGQLLWVTWIKVKVFFTLNEKKFIELFWHGNDKFDDKKNCNILKALRQLVWRKLLWWKSFSELPNLHSPNPWNFLGMVSTRLQP